MLKKLLILCTGISLLFVSYVPALAQTSANAFEHQSIIYSEAYQELQLNGLPSVVLSAGEEKRFDYSDGSSLIIGLEQTTNCNTTACNDNGVLRDPGDIMYNGSSTIYMILSNYIDGKLKNELRVYTRADYQYGSYKLVMKNVTTSTGDYAPGVRVIEDNSYGWYYQQSTNQATFIGDIDITYNDIYDNQNFRIKEYLQGTLTCGPFTVTLETNNNRL